MLSQIPTILFTFLASTIYTTEPTLSHIEQLTFPSQGFEKAGEAYFSPDSQQIIFQGVPENEENYQIYTMDLLILLRYSWQILIFQQNGSTTQMKLIRRKNNELYL